jgi:RHS repeat-associated protein
MATRGPETISYTYNELNQMVQRTDARKDTNFYYDGRGNLVEKEEDSSGTLTPTAYFEYDATNRMVQGTNRFDEESRYTFNALGQRVGHGETRKNSVEKSYVPDYTSALPRDLMIYTAGKTVQKNIYAGTLLEQLTNPVPGYNGAGVATQLYAHTDILGSLTWLSDPSGESYAAFDYNPWGEIDKTTLRNDYDFDVTASYTGHSYDVVLDVYFAQYRLYDAENKRFVAMDMVAGSIEQPLTIDSYLYCIDNPMVYADPWGLVTFKEGKIAHIIIESYIMALVPGRAAVEVTVNEVPITKSNRGYADVVIKNSNKAGSQVYEIKSIGYRYDETYNILGKLQLWSYVYGINETKNKYSPASYGRELQLDGVVLPFGTDKNKVLILSTDYAKDPGMIYYTIAKRRDKHQVQEVVVLPSFANVLSYAEQLSYKDKIKSDYPLDVFADEIFWNNVNDWIGNVSYSAYESGVKYYYPNNVEVYYSYTMPFFLPSSNTIKMDTPFLLQLYQGHLSGNLQNSTYNNSEKSNITLPIIPIPINPSIPILPPLTINPIPILIPA